MTYYDYRSPKARLSDAASTVGWWLLMAFMGLLVLFTVIITLWFVGYVIWSGITPKEQQWIERRLPNGVVCYFETPLREYPTWCDDARRPGPP